MKVQLAAVLLSLLAAAPALAQVAGEPDAPISERPGDFSIGLGVAYGPSYEGSDDYSIRPAAVLRADLGQVLLVTRGTYLYADVLDGADDSDQPDAPGLDFEFGPVAGVRLNRTSGIEDRRVRRLGELDAAIEIGAFAGIGYEGLTNPYDRLGARVEVLYDVADVHGGITISPSIEFQTPLSRSTFVGVSLSAEYVEDEYAQTYFSVSPAGAAASGLAPFNAEGGLKNWGASLFAAHSLSGDIRRGFALFGLANYKRLQDDFRRSPIVSDAGDADQWFGAAGVSYTF